MVTRNSASQDKRSRSPSASPPPKRSAKRARNTAIYSDDIDEEEFKGAIFELADHWCEGVDAIEHIQYLEMMYNRVVRDLIRDPTRNLQGGF